MRIAGLSFLVFFISFLCCQNSTGPETFSFSGSQWTHQATTSVQRSYQCREGTYETYETSTTTYSFGDTVLTVQKSSGTGVSDWVDYPEGSSCLEPKPASLSSLTENRGTYETRGDSLYLTLDNEATACSFRLSSDRDTLYLTVDGEEVAFVKMVGEDIVEAH